jgi:type I restriction enzyme S subunit
MLDLSQAERDIVHAILRKHVPRHEVWAFGSRTKTRRYSDLDLAVITSAPLSFAVSGALQEDFAESDLPFWVDILDWATTQLAFRRVVESDKVVVQPGLRPHDA